MALIDTIARISSIVLYGWFAEFLYFAVLQEAGNQFKIRRWVYLLVGDNRKLTPFISTGTYMAFIFLIGFFLYFFESLTSSLSLTLLEKLGNEIYFFFVLVIGVFIFWTAKFTLNRRWENKWVWVPLVVIIFDLLVWIIVNSA